MSVRKSRQSRAFENNETNTVTPARNPRHSIVYSHSPLASPSLSANVPFDWEAAKGNRPAPYQTPSGSRVRRMRASMGVGTDTPPSSSLSFATPRKPRQSRVIVRTSWKQWLLGLPGQWWLKFTMLQHDLPLPPPKTTGRIIGISLHLIHAYAKWTEVSDLQKADDGWGELNVPSIFADDDEDESPLWTRWPFLITLALFLISLTRTLMLFGASKAYDLQMRGDNSKLFSSPNVSLIPSPVVKEEDSDDDASGVTIWSYFVYILTVFWHGITQLVRFLVYHPKQNLPVEKINTPHIQRIQVWDPSDQDLVLFQIYSPLHAALWYLVQPGNWKIVLFVMVVTTFQLGALITAYRQLVKDREIVASEVMYEYNTRFVNPRLHPTKKDACVMTHESEMVQYNSGYSPRY
ncbi:hypothetical protein M408DRAFT_326127 [Serendipita vermifera MAFF 305830]|uniref:Nuclear rim protein 1 n=1 Tax=Serendipita vermifera MAFF 305830 TaxID=933852 RepID=A0A0C3B9A8_SERVB|nr:hypothetical protein M408DRAFT_326127 [Serendipita vermifera MAFF 305830]